MEAKDTVIRYQKKHPVVAGSAEWHMIDGYNLGAEAQAEISFKAGAKEVVEWLRDNDFNMQYHGEDGYELWQAKLKEWGVE